MPGKEQASRDSGERRRGREIATVVIWLAVLVGAAVALERATQLEPARQALRTEEGPAGTTGSNLGRILEQLEADDDSVPSLGPERLVPDVEAWVAEHGATQTLVSLVANQTDLDDPEHGISSNPRERGREWERVAYVSFYENAAARYSSRVGLRLHGGASRTGDNRSSWRLYFRDEYGSEHPSQPVIEGLLQVPGRLVLRKEPPGTPNLLAFEIARRNGALVPRFVPVRLLLNGDDDGQYVISDHINPAGWGLSHFGDRDFLMFIYRGAESTDERSAQAYSELSNWVTTAPTPLTMAAAGRRVDVDNLVRHMFTFFFCGTTDWAQGAAVRDESVAGALWSWVHWDLDQSFRDLDRRGWAEPAIGPILNGGRQNEINDVRTRLVRRLLEEDPLFRAYFVDLMNELLDDRTNEAFLSEVLDRYADLMRRGRRAQLREYFARRPDVLRLELADLVGSGP